MLDTSCCPHGFEDQIDHADAHMLSQRWRQIADLSGVPEPRRAPPSEPHDPVVGRRASVHELTQTRLYPIVAGSKRTVVASVDALGDLHVRKLVPALTPAYFQRRQRSRRRSGGPIRWRMQSQELLILFVSEVG